MSGKAEKEQVVRLRKTSLKKHHQPLPRGGREVCGGWERAIPLQARQTPTCHGPDCPKRPL
jgi:hypothetical protein